MSNGYPRKPWQGGGQRRQSPAPAPAPKPPAKPAAPAARKPVKVEGDAGLWTTLQKVTDPQSGWTKTTRAMQTPYGVVINTCSRKAGSASATEALCFVPSARINARTGKLECLNAT